MQRSQVNSPSWVMENSSIRIRAWLAVDMKIPSLPQGGRTMRLDRPCGLSGPQLAGAVGTKTRSQTRRPLGEPRVGKKGLVFLRDVATMPQGKLGEWSLLVFLESKHSFIAENRRIHSHSLSLWPILYTTHLPLWLFRARDILLLPTRVKIVLPPT